MDQHDSGLDNWLEGIDLSENAPDEASVLTDGEVDLKALLLRRFAWDTMACNRVAALLPKLGLTLSTPEGTEQEHLESHHRMASVLPFEHLIRDYSDILGTVLTTAITEAFGVTDQMSPEDQLGYVQQNTELILHGGRAMMAQLFFMGLIDYGPTHRDPLRARRPRDWRHGARRGRHRRGHRASRPPAPGPALVRRRGARQ